MAAKIRFDIQANNIGPHTNLDASFDTVTLQLGLYANNGSGKTFLSRIFRLITKVNPSAKDVNRLLTLGQNQGSFKFSVNNVEDNRNILVSSFSISLKRNTLPNITYDRKYIFHVFNDDYIKENLDELKYKPNGNIEGYILGKEKIDISKEKAEIDKLTLDLQAKNTAVSNVINQAKKDLESLGIRSQTREFSMITYGNIIENNSLVSETEAFDELKAKLILLKSAPDNLPELANIHFGLDLNILFQVQRYLESEFSRSVLAEDFKKKIRQKQSFIEEGLGLIEERICPFCEQELIGNSLNLIDQYNIYLNDSEAKQVKEADTLINFLSNLENTIYRLCNEQIALNNTYKQYQNYLSTDTDNLEEILHKEELTENINRLQNLILDKKNNISLSYALKDYGKYIDYINDYIVNFTKSININKSLIENINKRKNNLQNERLELNRKLIISKSNAFEQFRIYWDKNSRRYQPDFVAEASDAIYIIEVKEASKIQNKDFEVFEKARGINILSVCIGFHQREWRQTLAIRLDPAR